MLSQVCKLWSSTLVIAFFLLASLGAQASPSATNSQGSSVSVTQFTTVSLTTASATLSTVVRNGTSLIPTVTVVPVVLNVTVTETSTTYPSATSSATPTPDPNKLATTLDPAFGVLGAILILTGIPSAFLGHKNRWTSFFLIGFYTLSLVCVVLILKFGVLQAINPPSQTLRGLFVLACGVAGVAGGGIAIFFWKVTRYFIGAWGGLAFGLWIQCFRDGGLIRPVGFRWIMYIGCGVVGFVLCTIPKIHYQTILVSTAFVGATSFMLGVDCFTSADLKEFYMWNLGFDALFPRFVNRGVQFPVSQTMEIELGLLGAVALMGIAVQFRVLKILQRKLAEIKEEQHRRDEAAEQHAAEQFRNLDLEKDAWEREHPSLPKHGRNDSTFSSSPLMKEGDMSGDEKQTSTFTLVGGPRQRYQSGVSSFMAAAEGRQSPGALPALDLGVDLEADVPQNYITEVSDSKGVRNRTPSITLTVAQELEDLKKKEELLSEIQNIRRSLDLLKSETPAPSSSSESRRPSFTSRRTLSHDLGAFPLAGPSHLRPPRSEDPARGRVHSMDLLASRADLGSTIGRPTSVPLPDDNEDWNAYVRERKLLQPPSGVTQPIPVTPVSPTPRLPLSPAVAEALLLRKRRESSLSFGQASPIVDESRSPPIRNSVSLQREFSPDEMPIALRPQLQKSESQEYAPGILLPPRNGDHSPVVKGDTARVMSFEELTERHKEKLRQLQQPLTQSEREQADIIAARSRWERAKESEKQAVLKRQADQAAAASKEAKRKAERANDLPRNSISLNEPSRGHGHTRSLSADMLAAVDDTTLSSKRMSTMKVEDWQRRRLDDAGPGARPQEPPSDRQSEIPFPDSTRQRHHRESRRISTVPRHPPS
ncbi:hypothetical protein PHLCEN_2v8804 [Hermanssonia centrifuga]|uniref:TM7S3/TM198-like domain-containing protein n=1 Tax=Hermanssonia centrifuga TaxID=98765 RepID=A0A2R6NSI8_9APHY|nr:hypothetical protein PHLCEN_2v8804 [Hermanssonia centrifuga]